MPEAVSVAARNESDRKRWSQLDNLFSPRAYFGDDTWVLTHYDSM